MSIFSNEKVTFYAFRERLHENDKSVIENGISLKRFSE